MIDGADRVREWTPSFPLDIRRTLALHKRGGSDPTHRVRPDGSIWRTSHTPDGPGTLAITRRSGVVTGHGWGPGADWLLDHLPSLLGADDDPSALVARDPVVAQLMRRGEHSGIRLGRTDRVWEAFVPAVLEQKVVGKEAWRAWRHLVRRFGEPAPGAPDMHVCPPQQEWASIPSWEWHLAGAEPVRMRTVRRGVAFDVERHHEHLRTLHGVGRWTESEVRCRALGDPDVVPVGDYHVCKTVGQTLIGRPVDDAGMLELLEPYRGQRYRVVRLIELYGTRPERHGARMSMRDYRGF